MLPIIIYQGHQSQSPEVSQLVKLHAYGWYPKLLKRSFFWAAEPRPKLKKSLESGLEAELEGPGRRGTLLFLIFFSYYFYF